jgi:hypothetical protein
MKQLMKTDEEDEGDEGINDGADERCTRRAGSRALSSWCVGKK